MTVTSRPAGDTPSRSRPGGDGRIVVVGGGAAGALAALHFVRSTRRQVAIVERTGRFGPGVAYGTTDPGHLLNVPAGRLSFSSGVPADFVEWLSSRLDEACGDTFAPRAWYGEYLRHHLDAAVDAGRVELYEGEARSVESSGGGYVVVLGDGRRLPTDTL